MFEAGEDKLCDKVIFVTADEDVRIKRIMARDNLSFEEAKQRIDARNLAPIMEKCDLLIKNNGDVGFVEKAVEDFIIKYAGKDILAE